MGGNGSGRKRNESYNRRSDDQIDADNRKRQKELDSRRQGFFEPRQRALAPAPLPPPPPDTNTAAVGNGNATNPPPESTRIDKDHPNPTADNPLPGVNMSSVPEMFRLPMGEVLHDLRARMKRGQRQGNQYSHGVSSAGLFPWKSFDYQWPDPRLALKPPTVTDFLLPYFGRMRVFMPDRVLAHHLPGGRMPCKWHGYDSDCVVRDSFFNPQGPRASIDDDKGVTYIFTGRSRCKIRAEKDGESDDSSYFCNHSPEVLSLLPPNIRSTIGAVITPRRALSTGLIKSIVEEAAHNTSFLAMRSKFVAIQKEKFHEIIGSRGFAGSASNEVLRNTLYGCPPANNLLLETIRYDDVIPADLPSRQYLQSAFIARIMDLLPYFERSLQMIGGTALCGDKSYKAIKFVYTANSVEGRSLGSGSFRAYDSVYTVMNENNQVVAINFVLSGDNSEVESILEGIQRRYNIHGYEEVELFYTDSCCHEYNMLIKAMPSLARGDAVSASAGDNMNSRQMDPLLLPSAYNPELITSYESLVGFCDSLMESIKSIDTSESDTDVLIGFDVEWDTLTAEDKSRQKPELLQLATSDGKHIAVIKLSSVFQGITMQSLETTVNQHSVLRKLFDDSRVRACGVSVKGDVKRITNHYPEGLVGTNLYHRVFDPTTEGRTHYVIEHGRNTGRLKDLTEKFLGKRLNKV